MNITPKYYPDKGCTTIPKRYNLIKSGSDPFGPPRDQEFTYIFKFDARGFKESVSNIENSKLFNAVSAGQFAILPIDKKLTLLNSLSFYNMSSFWKKTDSNYTYDGDELFVNDRQHAITKAALKDSFFYQTMIAQTSNAVVRQIIQE